MSRITESVPVKVARCGEGSAKRSIYPLSGSVPRLSISMKVHANVLSEVAAGTGKPNIL